jgi:hypothetical protein
MFLGQAGERGMKSLKHDLLCVLAVTLPLTVTGCHRDSDLHESEATTYHSLALWLRALVRGQEEKVSVDHLASLTEVLDTLAENHLIEPTDRKRLEVDGWGRPFSFRVQNEANSQKIRIISSGKNGVFQEGKGDDIVLEITIRRNGKLDVTVWPPSRYMKGI